MFKYLFSLFLLTSTTTTQTQDTSMINCRIPFPHLIQQLYENNLIKFGSFTLKSGIQSSIYFDLRAIISFPETLQIVTDIMSSMVKTLDCDLICGVPYGALSFAATTAMQTNKPMIIKRKEVKEHGTKKLLEGIYKPGQKVVIIEDVITSGGSCLETIQTLEQEGLIVTDIVVIMNYTKSNLLQEKGYHIQALFTFPDVIEYFTQYSELESNTKEQLRIFATQSIGS